MTGELINLSQSILRLYLHIFELEQKKQDTEYLEEVVIRLSRKETELLDRIIRDDEEIKKLNQYISEHYKEDADLYQVLLRNTDEYDDMLVNFRIAHKANTLYPNLEIDSLINLTDSDILMIERQDNMDDVTYEDDNIDMEFNSYYDSLLIRTYDRVSSGLKLHYLKEYFTYYEALFTQDDILTLNRYQKLLKYIYPSLEENKELEFIPSIFRNNFSNNTQQVIFDVSIVTTLEDNFDYIINSILHVEEKIAFYKISNLLFYTIFLASLETILILLSDNLYIEMRDRCNQQFEKILEEEKTTCFEKPIHMIQEEFKKRDEKIGKSNSNNFYKVYY